MTDNEDSDRVPITVSTSKILMTMAGAILGIDGCDKVAAAIGLATDVSDFIESHIGRKKKRERERFERIVNTLLERTSNLEAKQYEDNEVDLFVEVMRKAIEDDEDAKVPIYSGILDWSIRAKPPLEHVRILSSAVRSLSYLEIYCFLTVVNGNMSVAKEHLEGLIPENVMWNRLTGFGLCDSGIRQNGSPTIYGRILADYCHVDDLPIPATSSTSL